MAISAAQKKNPLPGPVFAALYMMSDRIRILYWLRFYLIAGATCAMGLGP